MNGIDVIYLDQATKIIKIKEKKFLILNVKDDIVTQIMKYIYLTGGMSWLPSKNITENEA